MACAVQLGYAVWFSEWGTLSARAVAFLLQSGEHSAEHLERRVAAFVTGLPAKLAALAPGAFASQARSCACLHHCAHFPQSLRGVAFSDPSLTCTCVHRIAQSMNLSSSGAACVNV